MTTEEQNVELARKLFEAFRDRDADAIRAVVHPDGELKSVVTDLEGTTFKGYDGVERYLGMIDEVWEDWHTDDERFTPVGEEQVVCVYRLSGRGRGSEVPMDLEMALVWLVRDGLLFRGETFLSPDEAFEAANGSR